MSEEVTNAEGGFDIVRPDFSKMEEIDLSFFNTILRDLDNVSCLTEYNNSVGKERAMVRSDRLMIRQLQKFKCVIDPSRGFYMRNIRMPCLTLYNDNLSGDVIVSKSTIEVDFYGPFEDSLRIEIRKDGRYASIGADVGFLIYKRLSVVCTMDSSVHMATIILLVMDAMSKILANFGQDWIGFALWFREFGVHCHVGEDKLRIYITLVACNNLIHQKRASLYEHFSKFLWDSE